MHTRKAISLSIGLVLSVAFVLVATPALPGGATPPIPGDLTEQIFAKGFQTVGVGGNNIPGPASFSDFGAFLNSSGSGFAETLALYGSIVAPNEIEGLGASIAEADVDVPCPPPSCAPGQTSGRADYLYYVGLSGPGGVMVPVDITAVGQHSAPNGIGFAMFKVGRQRSGVCCDVIFVANSSHAMYGSQTGGSFVFSETIELDSDTDLLRIRTRADVQAVSSLGTAFSDASVDAVDFIVSTAFPTRNAYAFVLPEPSGATLQLAGIASVLALPRVRSRRRERRTA